jgi:hypothetical protein
VDDGIGDGRPFLVLLSYDAATVRPESLRVPDLVERIYNSTGNQGSFRQLKNNLVFLVADESLRDRMKDMMRHRLALKAMGSPERLRELAEHQQNKVHELHRRSEQELALSIQQCYRHLFFPSRSERIEGAGVDLGHTAFDVQSASEKPGDGQQQVVRALLDNKKLLRVEDPPLSPRYVRDQTPHKRGEITTAELRGEFRKDPRLPMMLGDDGFITLVRKGVNDGDYVYKSGDLIYGQGDPFAEIKIDAQSVVMTMALAKEQGLWPRQPKPKTYPPMGDGKPEDLLCARDVARPTYTPSSGVVPLPPEPSISTFSAEAPLREALTRIWEQARQKKVPKLASLRLRVFEVSDAFRLLSAIGSVAGAEKKVSMEAEYETTDGSTMQMEFQGFPQDALPLKEYLEPQFRAAKESSLSTTYLLTFTTGLPMDGDHAEKLTEKLARFATGAAFVEAYAEAAK